MKVRILTTNFIYNKSNVFEPRAGEVVDALVMSNGEAHIEGQTGINHWLMVGEFEEVQEPEQSSSAVSLRDIIGQDIKRIEL